VLAAQRTRLLRQMAGVLALASVCMQRDDLQQAADAVQRAADLIGDVLTSLPGPPGA
jgi:hypothetical protein